MKLEDLKKVKDTYTQKLSDINRNFAFVGVAIVWFFKKDFAGKIQLDIILIVCLILFILTLILDLIQYLYGSIVFLNLFRKKEYEVSELQEPDDFKIPSHIPKRSYSWFFFPKVTLTIISYLLLFIYLSRIILL